VRDERKCIPIIIFFHFPHPSYYVEINFVQTFGKKLCPTYMGCSDDDDDDDNDCVDIKTMNIQG
jgi:hypothetical protein